MRNVTRATASGPSRVRGALEHPRREVQRDHPAEPLGQVGQERAGAAAEVGHGLVRGVGDGLQRLPERILDVRIVRIDEQLVVLRRVPAPVAILVLKLVFGQRVCRGSAQVPDLNHADSDYPDFIQA